MRKLSRNIQSTSGVTLLEIMLVLAVAAMIIVMSVRYYQSANESQQATAALQQIQAITAAADSRALGSGGYKGLTDTDVQNMVNNGQPVTTPWGGTVKVSSAEQTAYTVTIDKMPAGICSRLKGQLTAIPRFTGADANACTAAGSFTYTYTSIPTSTTK